MKEFQILCNVDEVALGESRQFVVDGTAVAVFNIGGEFLAVLDACPHAGASLARGTIEGDVVRCRIHHWGFCLRDGRYVDQDQPMFNAKKLPLRVVGDEIQILMDDERS